MDKPLISVVVPVYNAENYLETCITSLLGQSYQNLEVILVDDASTDHSGLLCDRFAQTDPRVLSVRLAENGGVSHARNEGMRRMKGELLSFVDADDYAEANMLERLYKELIQTGADVSMCGLKQIGFGPQEVPLSGKSPFVASGREMFYSMLRSEISIGPCAKLYRAALAKQFAFDETIHCGEDLLYLYQLLEHTERAGYIPDPLYCYVRRENSATQKNFDDRQCTQLRVYEYLCGEAADHFPRYLPKLRYTVVKLGVRLAVSAVESGTVKGKQLHQYLKKFHRTVRRYFSKEILPLCPYRNLAVEAVLLYISAELFWVAAVLYQKLKWCWK